ncbi:hypothetical protein [Paraburkholderia tropica]|uniref:hypothetical protein n=1 Tax=Paraburkholderia tropica TaxID=92647 RepID=UPI0015907C90|nr:hypothetical protein [Paraburkholderia tropica]
MQTIAHLLTLAGFLSFVIGIIRPRTFARNAKPAPSRMKVCLASALVFAVGVGIAEPPKPRSSNSEQTAAVEPTDQVRVEPSQPLPVSVPAAPASAWSYADNIDQISGKPIHAAFVDSETKLNFGFPYNGGSTPSLEIRRHPRFGTDAILKIDKGQFVCGVDGCSVMVRFDDRKPRRYIANEPSDYSSTALFISPAWEFITTARNSKRVVIEASFFQEGSSAMVFPIEGLNWPK